MVRVKRAAPLDRAVAECSTLPEVVVWAVEQAAAPWRDPNHVARRLRNIISEHQLTGIAVWRVTDAHDRLATPPPIAVPFEPVPLEETHPALPGLCTVQCEAVDDPGQLPKRTPIRRPFVRLGVGLAPLIFIGVYALSCLPGISFRSNIPNLLGAVGAFALVLTVRWWLSDQWLIIPRGLVVRRSVLGKVDVMLRRYTPMDSVLIAYPDPIGWQIEIWHHGRRTARMATTLELVALLGAWQSPLDPPPIERLSDLREASR